MPIVIQWKSGGSTHAKTCHRRALHFGSAPPLGVEAIRLAGRGVAPHHGKIFWGQDGYRYVNLTELPTYLFRGGRGAKLEFELNPFYPQCTIGKHDKLVIGDVTIEVRGLEFPRFSLHLEEALKLPKGLDLKVFVRGGSHLDLAANLEVEKLAPLILHLRRYVSRHELVRQAADWLYKTLSQLQASLPETGPGAVEYANVRDVRWWELATLEPEFAAEPAEGNARSEPSSIAPWGRLIPPDAEVLAAGLPVDIQAYGRETVALAIGVRMDVPEPPPKPPRPEGFRGHESALLRSRNRTVPEGQPSYLFTVELEKGEPRPEYWGLLYHFGLLVSDALSDLAVRRKLLAVEFERDLVREAPRIFHDMKTHLGPVGAFFLHPPKPAGDAVRWRDFLERWETARRLTEYALDLTFWGMECLGKSEGCRLRLTPVRAYLAKCPALRPYWGHRTEETACELDANCPEFGFAFDKTALSLILVNLLRNALNSKTDPGPENPTCVAVWLRQTQRRLRPGKALDYAVFRVLDNGNGLEPSAVASIFQARFRYATGAGMGSAVVSRLVHWHEGFIEVASQKCLGTAVSIYLPCVCKDKLSRGDPELRDYRDYARARFGGGRWAGFETAMREHPDEYRDVWGWMRRRVGGAPSEV
jgi:hypothetical protein